MILDGGGPDLSRPRSRPRCVWRQHSGRPWPVRSQCRDSAGIGPSRDRRRAISNGIETNYGLTADIEHPRMLIDADAAIGAQIARIDRYGVEGRLGERREQIAEHWRGVLKLFKWQASADRTNLTKPSAIVHEI